MPPAPAVSGPSKNIVELAQGSEDLSTLVAALKAGDLVAALQGKGPFTVFAPFNAAFAKLPKATLASLLEPKNKNMLVDILTYHVVAGAAVYSKDLKPTQTVKTLNGQNVLVKKSSGGVTINGNSKVIAADIAATNGVVHMIDTVLMPRAVKKVNWKVGMSNTDQKVVMKLDGKNPAAVLFKWNGYHDVYMFPNKAAFDKCDFMYANNLGSKSPSIFSTSKAGTYYSGCTVYGHCENGQKLMLQVTAAPTKNIVQLALGSDDLSTLVTALKAGNLVGALQGKGPFTVFAPANAAFAKLPKATLASLLEPKNKNML